MVLLLSAVFPLYSQIPAGAAVHVPMVSGAGVSSEDNAEITAALKKEVTAWGFALSEWSYAADYIIRCMLASPGIIPDDSDLHPDSRLLYYVLQDRDGRALYENSFYYTSLNDAKDHITGSLASLFSIHFFDHDDIHHSLYAQIAGSRLYIPHAAGSGISSEFEAAFTNLIRREMIAWGFKIAGTPGEADYYLPNFFIAPGAVTEDWFNIHTSDVHLFYYALQDKRGTRLYERTIHFANISEAENYLRSSLSSLFSTQIAGLRYAVVEHPGAEPEPEPGSENGEMVSGEEPAEAEEIADEPVNDLWRRQDWYFGASFSWSPRLYTGYHAQAYIFNFGFSFAAEYHLINVVSSSSFLSNIALKIGLDFFNDWVVVSPNSRDEYRDSMLEVPLLINYVFRPGTNYMLELYAGFQFNFSLYGITMPPPMSFRNGFQYGFKAGPGILYLDASFVIDLGLSTLNYIRPTDNIPYNRFAAYVGIGYKYNLLQLFKD